MGQLHVSRQSFRQSWISFIGQFYDVTHLLESMCLADTQLAWNRTIKSLANLLGVRVQLCLWLGNGCDDTSNFLNQWNWMIQTSWLRIHKSICSQQKNKQDSFVWSLVVVVVVCLIGLLLWASLVHLTPSTTQKSLNFSLRAHVCSSRWEKKFCRCWALYPPKPFFIFWSRSNLGR